MKEQIEKTWFPMFIYLKQDIGMPLDIDQYFALIKSVLGCFLILDKQRFYYIIRALWLSDLKFESAFNKAFNKTWSHWNSLINTNLDQATSSPILPDPGDPIKDAEKPSSIGNFQTIYLHLSKFLRPLEYPEEEKRKEASISRRYFFSELYLPERQVQQYWRRLIRPQASKEEALTQDWNSTVEQIAKKGFFDEFIYEKTFTYTFHFLVDRNQGMIPLEGITDGLIKTFTSSIKSATIKFWYFKEFPGKFLYRDKSFTKAFPTDKWINEIKKENAWIIFISDAGATDKNFNRNIDTRVEKFIHLITTQIVPIQRILWFNPLPLSQWNSITTFKIAEIVKMFTVDAFRVKPEDGTKISDFPAHEIEASGLSYSNTYVLRSFLKKYQFSQQFLSVLSFFPAFDTALLHNIWLNFGDKQDRSFSVSTLFSIFNSDLFFEYLPGVYKMNYGIRDYLYQSLISSTSDNLKEYIEFLELYLSQRSVSIKDELMKIGLELNLLIHKSPYEASEVFKHLTEPNNLLNIPDDLWEDLSIYSNLDNVPMNSIFRPILVLRKGKDYLRRKLSDEALSVLKEISPLLSEDSIQDLGMEVILPVEFIEKLGIRKSINLVEEEAVPDSSGISIPLAEISSDSSIQSGEAKSPIFNIPDRENLLSRNPFIVGPPIKMPDAFFGRQQIVAELKEIQHRQVCLIGVRRIGKTSLLYQIARAYEKKQLRIPILINLQGYNASTMGRLLYKTIERVAKEHAVVKGFLTGYQETSFLEVLTHWGNFCESKKLESLLLIDEADQLSSLGEEGLTRLNLIFTTDYPCLSLIISGSRYLRTLKTQNGAFLFDFKLSTLDALSQEDAYSLLTQRATLHVSDENLKAISTTSGNHPYLSQYIASKLYDEGRLLELSPDHEALVLRPDISDVLADEYRRLTDLEKQVMRLLQFEKGSSLDELNRRISKPRAILEATLLELKELSFVHNNQGLYTLGNIFWEKYLQTLTLEKEQEQPAPTSTEDINPSVMKKSIFISYHLDDTTIFQKLKIHLNPRLLDIFDSNSLVLGDGIADSLEAQINQTQTIILLLSATYLADEEKFQEREAIKALKAKGKKIIPILASACDWEEEFGGVVILPRDKKPIDEKANKDKELFEITKEIKKLF